MISTHALTWSATFSTLARRIVYHFNSRTHVECDNFRTFVPPVPFSFQLTHSRGVRLLFFRVVTCQNAISTHALTWSATELISSSFPSIMQFQLTHSRGVRLGWTNFVESRKQFQLTHSRGVRLRFCKRPKWKNKFQLTHSRGVRR